MLSYSELLRDLLCSVNLPRIVSNKGQR